MPIRKILCGNSQLSVYHILDALEPDVFVLTYQIFYGTVNKNM